MPVPPSRRVVQLVTQLEPAGAQTLAAWVEASLPDDVETWFVYRKADFGAFPEPHLLVADRPRGLRQAMALLPALRGFRRRLRGADALVAHTHYAIVLAAIVTVGLPIRRVYVHHWPVDRYPWIARVVASAARDAEQVYVSPAIAPSSSATVIPNPVVTSEVGAVDRAVDVLCVARHAPEKDIPTLLRAIASRPDRRLTLIGGGPDTAHLTALIADLGIGARVDMWGRIDHDDALAAMRAAAVVVQPSLWEAMPMTILEAVGVGARLVVSDLDQHRFAIDPGAALAFHAGDPASLADALDQVASGDCDTALAEGRAALIAAQGESAVAEQWRTLLSPVG